jgi:hypothetical protein
MFRRKSVKILQKNLSSRWWTSKSELRPTQKHKQDKETNREPTKAKHQTNNQTTTKTSQT